MMYGLEYDENEDITGWHFNMWTVTGRAKGREKEGYWQCECECGRRRQFKRDRLEMMKNLLPQKTGCSFCKYEYYNISDEQYWERRRLQKVWNTIKQRCYNPKNRKYKDYGGRGIQIFEEWKKESRPFIDYIIKLDHYGEQGRSLDRIDNNGDYCPGNLRWATAKQQANNTRKTKIDFI